MSRYFCLPTTVVLFGALLFCSVTAELHAQRFQPFVDPCQFDYDLQWFKPIYCDSPDAPEAKTGWYFAYDRLYWNVTRPEATTSHFDGDMTWGNRYDVGYMLDEGHGWLLSAMHVHGPNVDEVNNVKLAGVELNKVFRLEPFHNGSILEPFIGVRYAMFWDSTFFPGATGPSTENNILGGQFGGRYYTRRGRWLLSSEFRFWFAENFQFLSGEDAQEFVPAGEMRLQAAFEITEKAAVRVGWDLLYFGKGIGRLDPVATGINDEDVLLTGLGFGVTLNR